MNYLQALANEVEAQLAPEHRPDDRGHELYRLYALLVLVRGEETSLKDVHDAWSTWMVAEQPNHPALLPFNDLRPEQQEQDRPYLEAIHRASRSDEGRETP